MRVVIGALAALVGCATQPLVADYDATCEVTADCEVVLAQGFCGACSMWAGLAEGAAAEFTSDQEEYADTVECELYMIPACSPMNEPPGAVCEDQVCDTTRTHSASRPVDFERTVNFG